MNHVRPVMRAAAILLMLLGMIPGSALARPGQPAGGARPAPMLSEEWVTSRSPLNADPITTSDWYLIQRVSTNNALRVLDNDYDPDGDPLTIIGVSADPGLGSLVISGTHLIYTPVPAGWDNRGEIYYTISDGRGGVAGGTVSISTYGAAPMPDDDYYRVTANSGPAGLDVRSNDSAGEYHNRIEVGNIGPPRHGTAVAAYGEYGAIGIIYTPPADFAGTDVFTYSLYENPAASAVVAITVAGAGENGAPIARDDSPWVEVNSPAIDLWVLYNDRDLDGDPLSITAVGAVHHGALVNIGSAVIYTPTADFIGTDSFTYTVSDGRGLSSTAFANLTVNPPLTLLPGFQQLPDDLPVEGQYYSAALVAGDGDAADVLSISAENLPAGLSLVDHGDRTATLSGIPSQTGAYTPTFRVRAGYATASVAMPLNVQPATITITSPPPAQAIYGGAYSHTLTAVSADPTAAITFSVTIGALPPGLSLDSGGVLSGTPTAAGTYPDLGLTAHSAAGSHTRLVTLSVSPAALTITANAATRPIGQPNPPLTARFSGFVLGDDPSAFSRPLALSTTATAASPLGSYAITAGGAESPNYAITFVPGALTVTRPLFLPLVSRP